MLNFAVKRSDSDNESALWNAADVGVYLDMHQSTVWVHLAQELIPKPVRLGGRVKWRKADIMLFVECHCDMKLFRHQKDSERKQGQ